MTKRPRLISLFSGAGGLDYGFEAAGFSTVAAVEMDAICCQTLRANRSWPVIEAPIETVASETLLDAAGCRPGDVDLVIGGPPCQPFSKAGYWASGDARRLDDPRARTLQEYMRVVEDALPRAFLLENVSGLAFSNKDEGLVSLQRHVDRINRRAGTNYQPTYRVLNAAEYGVPQLRHRFFMVASRDGTEFTFPTPTHAEEPGTTGLDPFRTAWDAIGDLPEPRDPDLKPRGKYAELLPSIPEGENYLWHTDRKGGLDLFGWRRRYWSFLLKLAKRLPAWTIQAQPGPAIGPFHWKNRMLSMRELCRLQTFPDDVQVSGRRGAVQRQLGNAVPSLLGEVLGNEIRRQFFGRRRRTTLSLLPPLRQPVPRPEPLREVPDEFLKLVGRDTAHPGNGQGRRATARRAVFDETA